MSPEGYGLKRNKEAAKPTERPVRPIHKQAGSARLFQNGFSPGRTLDVLGQCLKSGHLSEAA
jgi:hypothetical protein